MTVNTPVTAETTATTAPIEAATWTCGLAKNPGSKTAVYSWCMAGQPVPAAGRRLLPRARRPRSRPHRGAGDDQHPAVHVQHVHVVAVQPGEDLAGDDLVGGPAGGPPAGQVDDAVHHRQQRVHLVRGQQHGDLLLAGDPGEQGDDLLAAAQVEVGQRLVEQEQPGAADQGVRRSAPAAARRRTGSRPGRRRTGRRRPRAASPGPPRPGPRRAAAARTGSRPAPARPGPWPASACPGRGEPSAGHSRWAGSAASGARPGTRSRPLVGRCRPRITRSSVVLPAPLGPISPVNSPARTVKLTSSRICRPTR